MMSDCIKMNRFCSNSHLFRFGIVGIQGELLFSRRKSTTLYPFLILLS